MTKNVMCVMNNKRGLWICLFFVPGNKKILEDKFDGSFVNKLNSLKPMTP